ncbi:hypothetical protein [Thioalkalivibrio thiocyanodenitrificans]|uniref:hypothetical protein n=1 Tax=Thioalkalivibrio thiocyanodenitrificans TaxID=243063 RepID=UPI00035F7A56|nr:hypothetical protein [Thioalkalivibrio thiocyanodenitrificans]
MACEDLVVGDARRTEEGGIVVVMPLEWLEDYGLILGEFRRQIMKEAGATDEFGMGERVADIAKIVERVRAEHDPADASADPSRRDAV